MHHLGEHEHLKWRLVDVTVCRDKDVSGREAQIISAIFDRKIEEQRRKRKEFLLHVTTLNCAEKLPNEHSQSKDLSWQFSHLPHLHKMILVMGDRAQLLQRQANRFLKLSSLRHAPENKSLQSTQALLQNAWGLVTRKWNEQRDDANIFVNETEKKRKKDTGHAQLTEITRHHYPCQVMHIIPWVR